MEFKNDLGKPWKWEDEDGYQVTRSALWGPPGCHPTSCGVKLYVKDGKLVKIEGDENDPITHGRLCPRCVAMVNTLYNKDRLTYPIKRDPAKRGDADAWERCTWDEAYALIKEKFEYVKETWGVETFTVFEGTGRDAGIMGTEIAQNIFGSPNYATPLSGFACYQPRNTATMAVLGAYYPEMDYGGGLPEGMDDPEFQVPEIIVMWGKYPLVSNGDGLFGHAAIDLMKRGAKIISVDPRVTWLSTRSEWHLRLRPGTDTAMAMAWLNVIIGEDLYDHDFVEKWCYGFEQLAEAVSEMTPEKAAEITGVDAEIIRGAARCYANASPASICWGLAIDMNWNGIQCGHCILALMSICGNIDIPGGMIVGGSEADAPEEPTEVVDFENAEDATSAINDAFQQGGETSTMYWLMEGWNRMDEELQNKIIGKNEYPLFVGSLSVAQSDMVFDAVTKGEPYQLRMVWIHTSNLANCMAAEPDKWIKGLKENIYFTFATDYVMTGTYQQTCDLVLPVAMSPEHNSVTFPHYSMTSISIRATNKAVEPLGECKDDKQICCDLGNILGVECFKERYHTTEDWITYKRLYNRRTFQSLAENVYEKPGYEYHKYEKGLLRGDRQPGFTTASGRIELYSNMFEMSGESPLPYFKEPMYSPANEEYAKEYPFVLTSGARETVFFHSEGRQNPVLREINPNPLLEINPEDAAAKGIANGQWVEIFNHCGQAKYKAKVTPAVRKGVVMAQHGWWFPEKDPHGENAFGMQQTQLNTLVPNHLNGKLGFGAPYKNVMCDIRPLTESYDTDMKLVYDKFDLKKEG